MLVLSRKPGEKLVIDGRITITITRIAGNRVTVGIEAPDDVRIVRSELEMFKHRPKISPASREALPMTAATGQGRQEKTPFLAHREDR